MKCLWLHKLNEVFWCRNLQHSVILLFQEIPLLNDLQISTWSKPSRTILRQLKDKFIEVILGGRVFFHIGHSIALCEGKLSTDSEKGSFFITYTNLPIVVLPFLGSFNSPAESFFNMVWLNDRRVVHNQGQWDFNPNSFDMFRRVLFGFPPNGAISAIRPSGQNRRHRCQAKQRTWCGEGVVGLRRDVKRQTKA